MIIWLASYPRSGNTFLRILLNQLYNIPSSDVYLEATDAKQAANQGMPIGIKSLEAHKKLKEMVGSYRFDSFESLVNAKETYFIKTHNLPQEDFPAIYIVRDGRDAVVSHAHYTLTYDQEIPREEQPKHFQYTLHWLITRNNPPMGNWSHNVEAWQGRKTKTVVIRFEQLIREPVSTVRDALEELGISLPETSNKPPSFQELQELNPTFFQRGKEGRWKSEMSEDLHRLFWQYHGKTMIRLGYGSNSPDELRWSEQTPSLFDSFINAGYRRLSARTAKLSSRLRRRV